MMIENVAKRMAMWAERKPDHLAVIDREHRITYKQLNDMTNAMAASMKAVGIGRGDLVLTFMPNHYQLIVTFYAVNRVGATIVPCTSGYKTAEVSERMKKTPPKLAFCLTEEQTAAVAAADPACLVVTPESFEAFLEKGKQWDGDLSEIPYEEEDVGLIIYSSGTTGDPKGVQLTFKGIYGSAAAIAQKLEASDHEIFMMPLPLCHLFGIINGLLTPIYAGGTILLQDRFEPEECLNMVEREKATIIYGVPTMFARAITAQQDNPRDLSSLRTGTVAGALSAPQLIVDIKNVLHTNIMVAYGMSEMIIISSTDQSDPLERRANSVGRPYEGIEVKVINADREEVPPGTIGQLLARGFPIMKGYYNRPDLNSEIIDEEGWINSGDIVTMDQDGYIKICGRIKDIIIRNGRNILPAEVEKVYQNHPAIEQISVVGSPDPEKGEKTIAYVLLREGAQDTEEEIRLYAKERVIGYKAPDRVIILKEFPLLPNGKINRVELKKMAKTVE